MFGGSEKIYRLQKELDELRDYCIKFTTDVNKWAQSQGELNKAIDETLTKLKEQIK